METKNKYPIAGKLVVKFWKCRRYWTTL